MTQTHIRASINQKLINNSDRYYTASLSQMVDEIVQNARRAGSRNLTATLENGVLTIRDDGRGLAQDQAPVLLQLGGSNNTESVETAENAAGVGFFSLAHGNVVVRSKTWEMSVPKDAFTGKDHATLTSDLPSIVGLTLTVHGLADKKDYAKLANGDLLINACVYSGMRLILSGFGKADGIHEPRNFLEAHTPAQCWSMVEEIHGLTIKIVRSERAETKTPITVNFFGKVLKLEKNDWASLFESEEVVDLGTTKTGEHHFVRSYYETEVFIDVHDTSILRLQLPERNALILDAGFVTIEKAIHSLYVRLLSNLKGPNGIPYGAKCRSHPEATIAAPQRMVRSAAYVKGDSRDEIGFSKGTVLVQQTGNEIPLSRCFAVDHDDLFSALVLSDRAPCQPFGDVFIASKADLKKAVAPEDIHEVSEQTIIVKMDDEEYRIETEYFDMSEIDQAITDLDLPKCDRIIDDAAVEIKIGERTYVTPISGLAFNEGYNREGTVWAVKGEEPASIVSLMLNSLDWYSDEDSQSRDYQEDEARLDYRKQISGLFGGGRDIFKERITTALYTEGWQTLNDVKEGETFTLTIQVKRVDGRLQYDLAESPAVAA